jgi:hypothetical protein
MKTKAIIAFLIMTAGVLGLGFFAPWWASAIWVVCVAALAKLNQKQATLVGGFSIVIVWIVMARYLSLNDDAEIISKTGTLLGGISHQLMFVVTLVIALITGVLSGWLGSVLGQLFFSRNTNETATR